MSDLKVIRSSFGCVWTRGNKTIEDNKLTVKSNTLEKRINLDTPLTMLFSLNWEILLYAAIFVVAVITRFYDLGGRVMSHDESLHTLYSWNLYAGKGYQHDPLMHGPFLFHATALVYFLFGDNDFTARISTALLGTILVILPYWFRPWLGRIGALSASFMLLISPGIMYYSRYIRHDIFISVWTVLMVLAFFQYMRTRGTRWIFIGAAAVALMLSTKEVSYIHGFIGVTFIVMTYLGENLTRAKRQSMVYGLLGLIFVLVAAIAYMTIQADALRVIPPEGETGGFNPWDYIGIMVMITGLLVGGVIIQSGIDRTNRPVTLAIKSLFARRLDIGKAALAAGIIFVLLHTTFFTNISGLGTGTVGEISYWLKQQGVERGSQPWYYYLFLVPLYEFLPVFVGLTGALVYLLRRKLPAHANPPPLQPDKSGRRATTDVVNQTVSPNPTISWASDGGTFAAYMIYWTLTAFVIYSWAGEKMPWLTVHMTLPLIFLAAHVIQTALSNFDWSKSRQNGGLLLGGALLLIPAGLAAMAAVQPFRSQSLQSINDTLRFIAGIIVVLVLLGVIWYYGRQLGPMLARKTALVTVLLVMVLLTIRFAWLFNFVNFDYVNELMVYAHASPDVKLALDQIDEISSRTVGDKMIRVAYDNDSTWPLEWYMREYPNRIYYGENPTRDAMDSPVVIVGSANENKVKPYLGSQYTRFRYRLVWWPVEDYKGQTPQRLWDTYVTGSPDPEDPATDTAEAQQARRATARENRRKLWNIIFYRNYEDYDLNEWPFVHRFFVYVRNDTLNEVWDYQSGAVQLAMAGSALSTDPYTDKRTETDALTLWGSNGSGDGQFITPRSLAIGPDGSIYVADSGNHRVQVFDQEGNFLLKWGSEGIEPGQFNEPWGIAIGADGTVFVADTWNHRVQVFSSTGQFITAFGTFVNVQHDVQAEPGGFWGPRDIAIGPQGNLYVTDTGNKRIQKFTPAGEFLQAFGGGGIIPGTFEEPVGIDIDSQGNIYVADTWNRRIQKFDSNFTPLLQWDVVDVWESESVINKPYLAVDDQSRVFISDPEGYRVIAYDGNTGEILVTWGQYGQDLAAFQLPVGLEVDSQGNLLVADSDNNRIMKFVVPSLGG
jgi:uncharacterized protein (TIGR03663 family)